MKISTQAKARVLGQRLVAQGYWEIFLKGLDGPEPKPGQFLTILPSRYPLSLMRRPFAYSSWSDGEGSFLYEVRGGTSRDLALLPPDFSLDWMGPFGSAFPDPPKGSRPILLAGGIGVGPLYYLARVLAEKGWEVLLLMGARCAALLPNLPDLLNVEQRFCTDDGSLGQQGTVLAALTKEDLADSVLYACGPQAMLLAAHQLALEEGLSCWVSVEEMMACGVGACQGCVLPIHDKEDHSAYSFQRACVEGPVFSSRTIVW